MHGFKFNHMRTACGRACSTVFTAFAMILFSATAAATTPGGADAEALYEQVLRVSFSEPYRQRPHYRVERAQFGRRGAHADNALRAAARRTLTEHADIIDYPGGQKLFQPNGICYAARWEIDTASPYTGLFAAGTKAKAIVRISVMLSDIMRGQRRTLGMGIKLFGAGPRSYNLLVMDSVSGSKRDHVSDAVLDNHPELGGLPAISMIPTALRIRADLSAADERLSPAGANLRYRGLRHVAAAGHQADQAVVTPHWIRLRVAAGTPRVDADDFRDELALAHYPQQRLVYQVELADRSHQGKDQANWRSLGRLQLLNDVLSKSCDARLHFAHPRLEQAP